jgi:hypothetical protein
MPMTVLLSCRMGAWRNPIGAYTHNLYILRSYSMGFMSFTLQGLGANRVGMALEVAGLRFVIRKNSNSGPVPLNDVSTI